ncbi:MAG TPA: PEP-CTERM sorting domain-containing protein [Chthoniobacterales bacterium]|nr:PEP-CTERM sorting domain-containing protein [Chthoniobacterales bacterium]
MITPGDFNDWVGVDNITFTTVPEPSTWAMLAGGLLLVLVSVRRRLA